MFCCEPMQPDSVFGRGSGLADNNEQTRTDFWDPGTQVPCSRTPHGESLLQLQAHTCLSVGQGAVTKELQRAAHGAIYAAEAGEPFFCWIVHAANMDCSSDEWP